MAGNTFGQYLQLTTFGESHGPAMGAVIDGCPAGLALGLEHIQPWLDRRRPGQSAITTARAEADRAEIVSGVFEGRTLGTPICVLVRNHDARSGDYDPNYYRAGHADRVWADKYGHRDHRGGGRASGRETLGRAIGGAIAERLLPQGVRIVAFTRQIGELRALDVPDVLDRKRVDAHPTRCPDPGVAARIEAELLACKERGDSRGGIVELWIDGCPAGLGEPVFRKAKSLLGLAMMSIGAVVGVTLGEAHADVRAAGIDFHSGQSGGLEGGGLEGGGLEGGTAMAGISPAANGIQGGITNGRRICLQVLFKPASTTGSMARAGRHDPCIVPRAVPVVEAMAALVLADLHLASRLDRLTAG